jgi:hypothetical protein
MAILSEISWCFNSTNYITFDDFNKALTEFQVEVNENINWNPNEIVIEHPSVEITYFYWEREGDVVFKDERDKGTTKVNKQMITATFIADNGKNFSSVELLYKIHQRLIFRDLGDHVFFRGFNRN